MAKKRGFKQGIYEPFNKGKWILTESFDTKVPSIKYRSSYELKFMKFCDYNNNIVKVNSEGIKIPYVSPLDNKTHRYYMDFIIETSNNEVFLVEVKPYSQTIPPKQPKKGNKSNNDNGYQKALMTYAVNMAKWGSAKKYADSMGWKFIIITEKELGL